MSLLIRTGKTIYIFIADERKEVKDSFLCFLFKSLFKFSVENLNRLLIFFITLSKSKWSPPCNTLQKRVYFIA